jgi:hypothetical protein
METKEILKEELAKSAERLKAKGVELGKEALEEVALEMSDCFSNVAVRTENKVDDFFLIIKPMLDKELDKIDGQEG